MFLEINHCAIIGTGVISLNFKRTNPDFVQKTVRVSCKFCNSHQNGSDSLIAEIFLFCVLRALICPPEKKRPDSVKFVVFHPWVCHLKEVKCGK